MDSFNRIAGIAGIIPPGLAGLLRLDPKCSGVRECLQSSARKTNATLLADLSLSILLLLLLAIIVSDFFYTY